MDEEGQFLAALKANEDDELTRHVYADWLDEHDRPEDADRQRNWADSKRWLIGFVKQINYSDYRHDENGNPVLDEQGEPIPAAPDDLGYPHTYADAIEAGRAAVSGKGYCFGSDAGPEFFWEPENSEAFFRHWSIVTGVPVPAAVVESPPFRCAC